MTNLVDNFSLDELVNRLFESNSYLGDLFDNSTKMSEEHSRLHQQLDRRLLLKWREEHPEELLAVIKSAYPPGLDHIFKKS